MTDDRGWLLALDTATNTIVVAAGRADGSLIDSETFEGRYRHSQELLPAVSRLMERTGLRMADLAGIVVGMGPGAFTGLRVGLATAKTLAHELARPVVGIATGEALLDGAGASAVLLLPSGPRDRVAVEAGRPPLVLRADEAGWASAEEIAIDLDGRADEGALQRGRQALARLPVALLRLGAERLAAGEHDDPERLVPTYTSAPRGASPTEPQGAMAWSRDPR